MSIRRTMRLGLMGLVLLGARAAWASAAVASCQSPDLFGKAWVAITPAPGEGPAVAQALAWIWPNGTDPRLNTWQPAAYETCLSLPADAGVVVYTPSIIQALGQGAGGSFARQMLFRLGSERLGEARLQMQHTKADRLDGRGQMSWPQPHKGPMTALGQAQPFERPGGVPVEAVGFVAASVSPGRAWQELEAFAGGLWPLEATLVGTQITAWEQGLGNGQLADDIFGYKNVVWTYVLLPSAPGRTPKAALVLPVKKPQVALGFVRWALEIVSGLAPSLQVRTQNMQGQSVLSICGLGRATKSAASTLYIAASAEALLVATEPKTLVALQKAAPAPAPAPSRTVSLDADADAPRTAVVFGSMQHSLLNQIWGEAHSKALWFDALRLDPKGQTRVFVNASPDAWTWQTRSSRRTH